VPLEISPGGERIRQGGGDNAMKMIRLYVKCLMAVVSFAVVAMTVQAAPILLKVGKIDPEVMSAKRQAMVTTSSSDSSAVTTTKWIIQHDGIITDDWRTKPEVAGAKEKQITQIGDVFPPIFSYKLTQSFIVMFRQKENRSELFDLAMKVTDPTLKTASLAVLAKVIS